MDVSAKKERLWHKVVERINVKGTSIAHRMPPHYMLNNIFPSP